LEPCRRFLPSSRHRYLQYAFVSSSIDVSTLELNEVKLASRSSQKGQQASHYIKLLKSIL
jgi:hypothetical protein